MNWKRDIEAFSGAPANWVPGQDVIVGLGLNDEQAKERFVEINIELPYLRFTKIEKE